MPGLLSHLPVTDAERQANDARTRPGVVAAVLLVLALYFYLFTPVAPMLGLPPPLDLLEAAAPTAARALAPAFQDEGLVDSWVTIRFAEQFETTGEDLFVFYTVLAGAFLSGYFLPLAWKTRTMAAWAVAALVLLLGIPATAGLLLCHVAAWLVFHPTRAAAPVLLAGLLAWLAFVPRDLTPVAGWALAAALPAAGLALYRRVVRPALDRPRMARALRTVVAQSALLTGCLFAVIHGLTGQEFVLTLGSLLFFWQWCRMILYHVDLNDGLVPADLSLGRYLAVFFTPGMVPSWDSGVELGLGYAYTQDCFLGREKNVIVLRGLAILLLALVYLVLGEWFLDTLAEGCEALGVTVYGASIHAMVGDYMSGGKPSPLSVLWTSLLDTAGWTLAWVGIVHFKVGIWRICGHDFDPYFNRPWLATNLVSFWTRFVFHYREFLLRAFYYPIFFRFFRRHRRLRIVMATVAAAGIGNMVWGHLTEAFWNDGMRVEVFANVAVTWPYYVLLSGSIALTELYLLKWKRHRRPWTPGPRLVTDVLAAYATLQFFSVIHLFLRPAAGSDTGDLFRLFLRAFGLDT